MNKSDIELSSDRIEIALSEGGIKARVTSGAVTPRFVRFTLKGTSEGRVKPLAGAIAAALGVPEVRVERQGDHAILTVRRTDANPVKLIAMLARKDMQKMPACTATLGLCDDGAPLLVRLSSEKIGHIMVMGDGASSLLRTMVVSLALCNRPRDLKMVLVGRELGDLARLPHVLSYATDGKQAEKAIVDMWRRLGSDEPNPRIVIVIDDLREVGELHRLLDEGHAAGVYVVASGSVSLPGFKTLITGKGESGDFEITDGGQAIRFTAATITPAEVEQVVIGAMPRREPTRLQLAAAMV
jgi:DNA segregation ATPase FtsK/SpoIIIE-like protein